MFLSRPLLIYAAGLWVMFHLMVVLCEEPTLRNKFGVDYDEYCRQVPRWIPSLNGVESRTVKGRK